MKLNEETRSLNAIHCQEFPLLKVPYETLNRKFRLGQRIIESESRGISQVPKCTTNKLNLLTTYNG